jgi:hypothetical protein
VLAVALVGGVLVAGPARAFAPDKWHSLGLSSHQSITEQVFTKLAREYFSIDSPTKAMRAAMKEWTKADAAVDKDQFHSAMHFDGENFAGGQDRLVNLAEVMVAQLQLDNRENARRSMGQALHTVQDFYSHTNWVELGHTGANPDLGRAGRTLGPLATENEPTCIGSELTTGNLTSGYYGGEDRQPPHRWKCRHGGPLDFGAGHGGINKDLSDPAWSPHHGQHAAAVVAATAGTEQFVRDIRAKLTGPQLRALFGVGPTLAMAIDTTSSMNGIIEAVKEQAIQIVDKRIGTEQEPSRYVLAPFNDPGDNNPLTQTTDPDAFKAALRDLYTGGGGSDCPELSMTGLRTAIRASTEDSEVFLFTDADAKDEQLRSENVWLARKKSIRISPIIFGACPEDAASKKSVGKQQDDKSAAGPRQVTQGQSRGTATGQGLAAAAAVTDSSYRMIADGTGGQLFEVDYQDRGNIAKLVDLTSAADPVDVLNRGVALADKPTVLTVPVDSTMRKATFAVNGPKGATQTTTLTRPDGSIVKPDDEGVESVPMGESSGPATVLTVDRPPAGEWTVTIEGTGTASVRVRGESDLDLSTFEFVSPDYVDPDPSHGAYEPVTQNPPPGPVAVHAVVSADVKSAGFEFRAADGTVLSEFTLPRQGTEFAGTTTLPEGSPVAYVRGEDATGAAFQRTVTAPIEQSNPNLLLTPSFPESVLPGTHTNVSVTVKNLGPAGTFLVGMGGAWDKPDSGFQYYPPITLGTGESRSVRFSRWIPRLAGGLDETLTFVAREKDKPDNVAVVEQDLPIEVHPDRTKPVVTATTDPQPGPDGKFTDTVTVRLDATDDSGIQEITYTTGATASGAKSYAYGDHADVEIHREGLTRLWYRAEDRTLLESDWEHVDIDIVPQTDDSSRTWSTTPDGESVRAATTLSGQTARVMFPGQADQRVSIELRGSGYIGLLSASLRDPAGNVLAEQQRCSFEFTDVCFVEPVVLPSDGTYALVIDPVDDAVGPVSVRVFDSPEIPPVSAAMDGAKHSVTIAKPGQNAGLTFSAKAGDRMSVVFTDDDGLPLRLQKPNGDAVPMGYPMSESDGDGFYEPAVLPDDGQYTLWVDPQYSATGSVTLQLYEVPEDASARIEPDADPVTIRTVTPGQSATLTFAGQAGQRLTLQLSDATRTLGGVSVHRPGGYYLDDIYCATDCTLILPQLPETGDYRVDFPTYGWPTAVTARLLDVSADATATTVVDGPETTVATMPGQNAAVSFAGSQGQVVSLTAESRGGGDAGFRSASLRDAAGNVLDDAERCYYSASCFVEPVVLPHDGTYTLSMNLFGLAAGSVSVQVFDSPEIPTVSAAMDGVKHTVTIAKPGQNAGLSFSAKAGDRLSVVVTDNGYDDSVPLRVQKPDGDTEPMGYFVPGLGGNGFYEPTVLPDDGRYTLWVDPRYASTGSVTLQLYEVPEDVSLRIEPAADPVTVRTVTPGQSASLVFAGRAGQRLTLRLSDATQSLGGVSVYRPDGYYVGGSYCVEDCVVVLPELPETGDYRVDFPVYGEAMTVTAQLLDVSVDATATAVIDGPETTVTTLPGQNAAVSFAGAEGQTVSLTASLPGGHEWLGDAVLRDPDGTAFAWSWPDGDRFVFPVVTLPATGTYTVTIDPYGEFDGPITVEVHAATADDS